MRSLKQIWQEKRDEHEAKKIAHMGTQTSRVLNDGLIQAVQGNRPLSAKAYLEAGASADAQLYYEHGTTTYSYPLLTSVIRRGQTQMAALLLQYKADPAKQDSFSGHTPLHEAAIYDRADIMRMMLDTGMPLNTKSSIHSKENVVYLEGVTALEIAKRRAWKDVEQMLSDEPGRREQLRLDAEHAREEAAEAARRAAEEERTRAAEEAKRQEQERLDDITNPRTYLGKDIKVTSPLSLQGVTPASPKPR